MMRYLLVCLLLSSPAFGADNNLVILFDTSSSMLQAMPGTQNKKIDVAKDGLHNALAGLSQSTNVGVLTFSGWTYDFGPVNEQKLNACITKTAAYGGTPLWQHMKVAADKLLEMRKKNNNSGIYKLVVVTDGEAGDQERGYLADIISRGIVVDTVAVAMASNHTLESRINGTYMRADDPKSLKQAMKQSVAEVSFQDSKGDPDFVLVSSLPEEFANGIVGGFTAYANQPIGEKPPEPRVQESQTQSQTIQVTVPTNSIPGFYILCGLLAIGGIIFIIGLVAKSN